MGQLHLIEGGYTLAPTASLREAIEQLDTRLMDWASNNEAYQALLLRVFRTQSSVASASLQAAIMGSGLAIDVEFLPSGTLAGINGAYASKSPTGRERIYLNAAWLTTASAAEIEAVLLEEIGHAMDQRLNSGHDSPGDEGEIFSALLRGQNPKASALSEIDRHLISINGAGVVIEASGADITPPTGSLIGTAPAYAAASTNPFGITDVGFSASPAFADVDGDGDLDLFIGERLGRTLFYRNSAAAGATAPAYAAASMNPFGITDVGDNSVLAFADVDGDGDLDLFIGNALGNTLVFRNTAGAGATAPAYAAASTNPFGITNVGSFASPALADIDGDGDLDLFIGNALGNTLVFRNTAGAGATAPAYAAASTNPFGITNVGGSASPTLADIDGDGDLDLFIGNNPGNTLVFRNTAGGGATVPAYAAASTNPFGITDVGFLAKPALADVDADGDLDLFIGERFGTTIVYHNTAPTPVAPVRSSTPNGAYRFGSVITLTVEFSEPVLVSTAGGTPILQLATGAFNRFATYVSGSGTTTLSFRYVVQAGDTAADLDQRSATALQLNGGSIRDAAGNNAILRLAAPGEAGSLAANAQLMIDTVIPRGSPGSSATNPAYAAASTNPFGITGVGHYATPAFADIDGDGDLDLFIGEFYGNTLLYTNTAAPRSTAPAYAAPVTNPYGITDVGNSASPAFADIDGDGDLDLFIGNNLGNMLVFCNTAVPGATAPAYAAASTNPFGITDVGNYATPAFADVDGDGDLDLFIGNDLGNTLVFRNTAAAGSPAPAYAAASTNPYGITDVGFSASPAFADIDGDGDLDLFIGEAYGTTLVYLNTAATGATAPAYAVPSVNPYGITDVGFSASPALADVDGDGDLDLVIGERLGATLVYRNSAPSPVAPVRTLTADGFYRDGSIITLTVEFSEAVLVSTTGGTPTLQLETGQIDRVATYSSGSGTTTLSFSYTVQAGDNAADLDQLSSAALQLNGGSIRDLAGNDAILTLAAPGAAGSLAANAQLVIDAMAPTISGITLAGAQLQLAFSEPIDATGLTLTNISSRFSVMVAGVARAITGVAPGTSSRELLLTLATSTTLSAPTSSQSVTVSYSDPVGDDLSAVVQDLAGNDMFTVAAPGRSVDTLWSSVNVSTLASSYSNLVLTGTAAIGTGHAGDNRLSVNQATAVANVFNGGAGVDVMDAGNGSDIYLITDALHHPAAEIHDTGTIGIDELRFASTTAGQTLTVFNGDTGLERVAIVSGTTPLNVNAGDAANGLLFIGNDGTNIITGSAFADTLNGGAGIDVLLGGGGGDLYLVTSTAHHSAAEINDTGTTGIDELRFTSTTAGETLMVFAGDTGLEQVTLAPGATALHVNAGAAANGLLIIGNDGSNTITGSAFTDTLNGGAGTDQLLGGGGGDLYLITSAAHHSAAEIQDTGTTGIDELRFDSTIAGQTLTVFNGDIGLERVTIAPGGTSLHVNAGNAPNGLTITGNDGINTLTGSAFADGLTGGGGNDTLIGGLGHDTLQGGLGADQFFFNSPLNSSTNVDVITDFNLLEGDRILLASSVFTTLTTVGPLAASAFVGAAVATTAAQRILHNPSTGNLLYDPDGNGPTPAILFAVLSPALTLTSSVFRVI